MTDQPPGTKPTSYAERYQGTPWGRPSPPPPPPPSSKTPRVVVGLVVIAIVVAGVGLVALAAAPSRPSISAATKTPAANGGSMTPRAPASPTPSPSVDPGVAIKDRFWALVSASDLSYRLTGQGKSVLDRKTYQTFSESFVVVGDDYSGSLKGTPKGPELVGVQPSRIRSAQIARKDGIVYTKEAGKIRSARRSAARADRLTPFMYVDLLRAIDYVKPVTVNGRQLHLLRTNGFYRPDIARMLDIRRFATVPDSMGLDLYVTAEGIPVSGVFTLDVRYHDRFGGAHRFQGRSTYSFTSFGAKLAIRIPKR